MENISVFGVNIRKIRHLKNWSQTQMAEELGLTRGALSSYEEGRAEPKLETVIRVADYFGLFIDDLLRKKLTVNQVLKFQNNIEAIDEEKLEYDQSLRVLKHKQLGFGRIEEDSHWGISAIGIVETKDVRNLQGIKANYFIIGSSSSQGMAYLIYNDGQLTYQESKPEGDKFYCILGWLNTAIQHPNLEQRLSALERKVEAIQDQISDN